MIEIPFFSLKKQHLLLEKALAEAFERVMNKGWFVMGEEVQPTEIVGIAGNLDMSLAEKHSNCNGLRAHW